MATIIRNGKAYDSGDATAYINGVEIELTDISYGNEQEKQLNHTLKNKATSWSRGKITPSCTMGIMMHDIAPLEKAAASVGGLLNVKPFDVVIVFANEFNEVVQDTLLLQFQREGREVTGEMGLKLSYEMFAMEVNLNV
ncbi:MAG: hypothetical protein GX159_09880 [Flavobacteriaceae bacterium]|jgi:hypothetical protein|nr:hypothetical protein [Flavobacteriaceae bacterium]